MTLGMFVTAASIHFFLVPGKLILGSISGLAVVLHYLTPFPVSVITLVLNGFLLILSYLLIGKEFGLKTVYSALIMSPWLWFFEKVFPVTGSVMGDPWLDLVCFVLMLSAAQAVLFKINASTGGSDIIAKLLNKYLHLDMGNAVIVTGLAICLTAFFINDFRLVIVGMIGTWLNGLVINHFTAGLNTKKRVCIISPEHERIRQFIVHELVRGVTLYEVRGGYSQEKKVEIESLLTKYEFAKLMEFMEKEQINAFTTAGNVTEVYGLWFNRKNQEDKRKTL